MKLLTQGSKTKRLKQAVDVQIMEAELVKVWKDVLDMLKDWATKAIVSKNVLKKTTLLKQIQNFKNT